MECCTTLDFSLITKLEKYHCRSVNCSWQTATLQKQRSPSIAFDEEADVLNSQNKSHFFFYICNLHVFKQTFYIHQVLIYLDVPGISSKKAIAKQLIKQLDVCNLGKFVQAFWQGQRLLINKKDKNYWYTKIKIMVSWRKA